MAKRTSILIREALLAEPPEGYQPRRHQAHRDQALNLIPTLARSPREGAMGFEAWNGLTHQKTLTLYPQECWNLRTHRLPPGSEALEDLRNWLREEYASGGGTPGLSGGTRERGKGE